MTKRIFAAAWMALSCICTPVQAEDKDVPYWASIRADEVNMRVGPGEDYRVLWVYHRASLPLKVLRIKEGWRLVQDPQGARGWILARFLSRSRGAIVTGQGLAELRESGDGEAKLLWRLAPGVTGRLGDCSQGWCRFDLGGRSGFVQQDRVWGAGEP